MPTTMSWRRRGAALALAAAAVTAAAMTGGAPAHADSGLPPDTLIGWGANSGGQLGNGGTTAAPSPVTVSLPTTITAAAIAVGANHTLVQTASGGLLTWGTNSLGQLGNNTRTSSDTPVSIPVPGGQLVREVAAGNGFSLMLTAQTDQVYAWGGNGSGQLGDGTSNTQLAPEAITVPGSGVADIRAGTAFSMALTLDHQVYVWGGNRDGELGNLSGNGSATPELLTFPVASGVQPVEIAAGGNFALASMSDGTVYAWGAGANGQLGDGSTASSTPVKVSLPATSGIYDIAAGGTTGYAINVNGQLFSWGGGSAGQLGNGSTADSSTPVQIPAPAGTSWLQIAGGAQSAVATDTGPGLLAWGTGAIGQGTSVTTSSVPVAVPQPSGFASDSIGAGPDATAAFSSERPPPPPVPTPVLRCDVIPNVQGGQPGPESSGTCGPTAAAASYVVDNAVSDGADSFTWTIPAGASLTLGCGVSDDVCDWTVKSSTADENFTTSVSTFDENLNPVSLTIDTSIPAVCKAAFC